MGKPGPKQVPVTAKIQKSTVGGVVQPSISGMGSIATMKVSSPAKQGGRNRLTKEERDQRTYSKNKSQYDKDIKYMKNNPASERKKSYLDKGGRGDWMSSYDNSYSRAKEFENNLYNYDKKNKPDSTKGYNTAKDYATAKVSGTYKKEESKTLTPKNLKARSEGEAGWAADDKARKNKTGTYKPTSAAGNGKKSYDQAYKDRDKKTYGKMDKATYIKEAKRQNASKKAGKGYDVKNKTVNTSNNASTSNGVATTKITKKQEATQSAKNNIAANTKKKVNTKVTVKPTSRQVRKNASADKKDSRAKRVSVKAEAARASGNTAKADRLDRRVGRIKNRAAKKRGQASKAIEPK